MVNTTSEHLSEGSIYGILEGVKQLLKDYGCNSHVFNI